MNTCHFVSHLMRTFIGIAILSLAAGGQVKAKEEDGPIRFGIVPQQSASTLARLWSPILQYLEQQTGQRFVFSTAPDIPTFEQRLANGEYDIAYMNPYHYTMFHKSPGYVAFAKAKNKQLRGILVVRKDADIQNLKVLNGADLAFPAPAAFAASVLPQVHLRQQRIRFSPKYVSSHDSVYRTVAQGLYPAGGGVMRTFNSVDADVRDQLRILWTTPGYTSHAIAAHPRLSAKRLNAITKALTRLGQTQATAALIDVLKIKGFEAAKDARWDDIRRLNLNIRLGVKKDVKQ